MPGGKPPSRYLLKQNLHSNTLTKQKALKKSFPIILAVLLLGLTSCLKEGTDGCDAGDGNLTLTFSHNGSVAELDGDIGNDIYLLFYKDGTLHSTLIVPFPSIEGGTPYQMQIPFTGQMDLVAFAVPQGGNTLNIPQPSAGARLSDLVIQLPATASPTYGDIGELFMGRVSDQINETGTASYEVSMRSVVCKVKVNIIDADLYTGSYPGGDPSLEILGTVDKMNIDLQPAAGYSEATVATGVLQTDVNNYYTTGRFLGLLAGVPGQTIVVKSYSGDTYAFTVDTGETAVPRSEIIINIYVGFHAQIIVDGWEVAEVDIIAQ